MAGDSPMDPATGVPLWAEPGYRDGSWQPVILTQDTNQLAASYYESFSNGGWSKYGHKGYLGYAWYRMQVPLTDGQDGELAIAEMSEGNDAYQMFWDGKLVGSCGFTEDGQLRGALSTVHSPHLLPMGTGKGAGGGVVEHTLAIRVWAGATGLLRMGAQGGLLGGPSLGRPDAIRAQLLNQKFRILQEEAYPPMELLLLFLVAMLAWGQKLFDRDEPVYGWIGSMLFVTGLYNVTLLLAYSGVLDIRAQLLVDDVVLDLLMLGGWALVWWVWFRFRRPKWIPWGIAAATVAHAALRLLQDAYMFDGATEFGNQAMYQGISTGIRVVCLLLLFAVVVLGIKRHGREGWFILPFAVMIMPQQFTGESN